MPDNVFCSELTPEEIEKLLGCLHFPDGTAVKVHAIPFDVDPCDNDCKNCDELCYDEDECYDVEFEAEPVCYGIPEVERVIISGPATTILWEDGTKTTVKCIEGQPQDRYAGFCAAVCKKLFGSTSAAKKLLDECDADLIRERAAQEEEERKRQAKKASMDDMFADRELAYEDFKKEVAARAREMIVQRAAERRIAEIEKEFEKMKGSSFPFYMDGSHDKEVNED